MKKLTIIKTILIASITSMLFSLNAFGVAFDNSGVGIRGFSMGSAFTGVANDASAVYYNPGGLVFIGENKLDAELYAYRIQTDFAYENAAGEKYESDETPIVPGFFLAKTFSDLALGIGVYIPYGGGGTAYKDFSYGPATNFDRDSEAAFFAFTVSASYKILSNLAAGVGVSAYYGILKKDQYMGPINGNTEMEWDGLAGYGVNLGLLLKPTNEFSIGASVRSQVPIEMDGKVKNNQGESDSTVEFTIPYYFVMGVGYQLTPDLLISLDFWYMLWEDMDKLTITTETPAGDEKQEAETNYKNSYNVCFGIEYKLSQEFALRLGLKYEQSSTEDKGLDSSTNDVDRFNTMLGVGYSITNNVEVDLTGIYVYGFEREYQNQKYDQDHIIILLGTRGRF